MGRRSFSERPPLPIHLWTNHHPTAKSEGAREPLHAMSSSSGPKPDDSRPTGHMFAPNEVKHTQHVQLSREASFL